MTGTVLYDADCGFCTRVARLAAPLRLEVDVKPLQSVDLDALGVSPERATAELPFVSDDGSVEYGHAAIAAALRTGGLPYRVLGSMVVSRPLNALAVRAYAWVSRHRHQLPGGTPACELPVATARSEPPV